MPSPHALPELAAAWLRAGVPAMEVQVLDARGSVPRGDGTRMLVSAEAVAGTIGGGHLELKAIAHARELLRAALTAGGNGEARSIDGLDGAHNAEADPSPAPVDRHYPLGPALGQCCGGALTLRTQRLTPATLAQWPNEPPLFTLQLYGAGHVGRAIAKLLEGLNCRVQWIDEREAEFPSARSAAHLQRLCVEPVEAEVATAAPGTFYLVLTHSHDLDQRITEAILRRSDFGYLGLIGSATKRARFMHRFEQRGINASTLNRLTCPIGVAGIGGKEPEVIAVAVVAQLLQCAGGGIRPSPLPSPWEGEGVIPR